MSSVAACQRPPSQAQPCRYKLQLLYGALVCICFIIQLEFPVPLPCLFWLCYCCSKKNALISHSNLSFVRKHTLMIGNQFRKNQLLTAIWMSDSVGFHYRLQLYYIKTRLSTPCRLRSMAYDTTHPSLHTASLVIAVTSLSTSLC